MLIEKSDLLKTIRAIAAFDNTSASPYVAIHFPPEGKPEFYRSSSFGFIQTKGFDTNNLAYVSLAHLQDCLKISPELLEISLKPDGTVRLHSTESIYDNVYHVHSVRESSSGLKAHVIGEPRRKTLPPDTFLNLDVRPFTPSNLKGQPILKDGRLTFTTDFGNLIWAAPECLKTVQLMPSYSFLRFACGQRLEDLVQSEKGYWGAVRDDLVTYLIGHMTQKTEPYDVYNVPGTEVARFPASRLVDALSRAVVMSNNKVELDPKTGVSCRDNFGNEQKMAVGTSNGTWPKFSLLNPTAKLIVDILSQSSEEEAVLYMVPGKSNTLRLVRGNFETNFMAKI